MGSEALLQQACELAFAVARQDAEADPAIEPPGDMRSFLYLARLPRRAIAVAQQAIEDDSEFRSRVAAQASESEVGRVGYLWLHRPIGWAPEFEALTRRADQSSTAEPDSSAQIVDISTGPTDHVAGFAPLAPLDDGRERSAFAGFDANLLGTEDGSGFGDETANGSWVVEPAESVPAYNDSSSFSDHDRVQDRGHRYDGDHGQDQSYQHSAGYGADMQRPEGDTAGNEHTKGSDSSAQAPVGSEVSEVDPEADAIESELSSLRGLVDRLAGERDAVMSSSMPAQVDNDRSTTRLEEELSLSNADLDSARHELSLVQQELASARSEREEARRAQSDALRRQVELERELAAARESKAGVDSQASDLQVNVIALEDRLKRITGDRDELERERNVAQSQLETMTAERNHIREDRMAIKAERDDMAAQLREVEEKTGGVDVGELTAANRSLTQELEATSRELARMIAQVESLEQQLNETTSLADRLKVERTDLSSRLADAELALDTTSTKYESLKGDSERLASEVGSLRAERDGLQSQLTELQTSLTEVLDEQAEIRHRNDADRKALNELRVERDVLVGRMAEIEQVDRSYENRINALVKERDDLMSARDDLVSERGQLRGEAAAAASAREQLMEKIDSLEGKIGPLETELQAERRQREELANRLLELDEIAAANQAATERLSAERDSLNERVESLSGDSKLAKELRRERDQLQTRVERAEQRAEAAEKQLGDETTRKTATITELTEKVSQLESGKTNVDNELAEARSELNSLRADMESLNRDNAKLRFNLQVAEASFTEATEAAEAARREVTAASDRASRAEAEAEQARAASQRDDYEVSALAGSSGLAAQTGDAEGSERNDGDAEIDALTGESAGADESAGASADGGFSPFGLSAADDDADTAGDHVDATDGDTVDGDGADSESVHSESVHSESVDSESVDSETGGHEADSEAPDGHFADSDLTASDSTGDDTSDATVDVDAADGEDADHHTAEAQGGRSLFGNLSDPGAGATGERSEVDAFGFMVPDDVGEQDYEVSAFDVLGGRPPSLLGDEHAVDLTDDGLAALSPLDSFAASDEHDEGVADSNDVVDMDQRRTRDETRPFSNNWEPQGVSDDGRERDELDEIGDLISQAAAEFESDGSMADTTVGSSPDTAMSSMSLSPPSVFNNDEGSMSVQSFGRRQIDIPNDIADDEIAVAQFVVSSPDIVLLVDGDSVAQMGWPSLPVAQQRDALVTYLADLSATSGAAPDVVFDGRMGDDDSLPRSQEVRIRLSTPPTEPAAALDELVSAYPEQWPIALVTDDATLAASAQDRGATVLNNGQLLDLFIAQ